MRVDTPISSICTCNALRKLTRTTSRVYDLHLAPTGLKVTQYALLSNISREARPIQALAAYLATERTTLTRNLKALVEAGWVSMAAGADSRTRIVSITQAGKTKLESARPYWKHAQHAVQHTLGADDTQALHALLASALERLTPLLEDVPDDDA